MPESPAINSEGADGVVRFSISSDRNAIADTVEVISISIDRAVNTIPSARLVFADGDIASADFPLSSQDVFRPGAEISVSAGYGDSDEKLFDGIIVRHGIEVTGDNHARLIIECRDQAVKMTIGDKTTSFTNQNDSDIIATLVGKYGFSADIAATGHAPQVQVQVGCTDWDYLLARTEASGFLVIADNGKITAKPPQLEAAATLKVGYGEDLIEFHADVDAQFPPTPATTDWNAKMGKLVEVQSRHGSMKFQGSAKAKVGEMIDINGVGNRFNGKVFITGINHELAAGNWVTEARFGLAPKWFLPRVVLGASSTPNLISASNGLQLGVVEKFDDPLGENRVLVSIPSLAISLWARLASFYASNGFGAFFIPEIGDEVVLGFRNDDPAQPMILGSLYSSSRSPPYAANADNHTKAIVTRSMAKIEFDDAKRTITIQTPANNKVLLSDEGQSILLQDQHDNKVELSARGIVMESPKDIRISAKGTIKIDAIGAVGITSKADVSSAGLNVHCEAQIGFAAKAGATAELTASGETVVKGGLVKIN